MRYRLPKGLRSKPEPNVWGLNKSRITLQGIRVTRALDHMPGAVPNRVFDARLHRFALNWT
jgi:hypothetical protein